MRQRERKLADDTKCPYPETPNPVDALSNRANASREKAHDWSDHRRSAQINFPVILAGQNSKNRKSENI